MTIIDQSTLPAYPAGAADLEPGFELDFGPELESGLGRELELDLEADLEPDLEDDGPTLDSGPAFADLGLPDHLLAAIADLGFETPTEIQSAAIPALLGGHDIVGVAQTGTGKTAAFGLPLLDGIVPEIGRPQALVLAPTRELALQVAGAIEDMARTSPGVRVATIYGGAPYGPQRRDIEAGAQIVVGTPGRIIDHLERGTFTLAELRFLVLDEGDEMLRMGFAEEVDTILSQAPEERLTALFSATMPAAIRATAAKHLRDPLHIAVTAPASAPTSVDQRYAVVPHRHKAGALARILATSEAEAAIVFVRTRADVDEVAQALTSRGLNAAGISGDVAQRERERIVEQLRNGRLDVLVATDVAARGLDVDRIGLVVNFDLPTRPEIYVHRIGRTGRAGRTGVAFTFVTPAERGRLRAIERTTGDPLTERPVPTAEQVTQHRYGQLLRQVPDRLEAGRLQIAYRAVAEALEQGTDPVALAAAVLALAVDDAASAPSRGEDAALDAVLAELRERDQARSRREAGRSGGGRSAGGQAGGGRGASGRDGSWRDGSGRGASGWGGGSGWDSGSGGPRRSGTDRPAGRRPRDAGGARPGAQRYWVGVGHGHGARPGAIVGAITGETKLTGSDLGRIEMFKHFSLVEIGVDLSRDTMRQLAKAKVAGRALRIRPDEGAPR
ncbi:MAG: DEAD/DEAH box helicase [Bifidobacteriaceae bacterium]|jgi:ATP-dependent RNA helicase DeaD|nr:DEAD/DEAH box helicase [Bifidobacteriaceae bacterium]